ncbi:hypothetical protein FUAX_03210 [Fulvitalea axinellae]|uniref:Uncharacterized protein n=1 Tax=Fulvitalea axinellae TaxID=1182444 RepID=A0AAU9C7A0_9BACT|nr:hypothetical protein FUAX_03210 [Fulvitalea axinellae]
MFKSGLFFRLNLDICDKCFLFAECAKLRILNPNNNI